MPEYWDIKDKKKIITKTEIPKELLKKKGLKKYKKIEKIEIGKKKDNKIIENNNEVIEYVYHNYTNEEYKKKKKEEIWLKYITEFPHTQEQINAILGLYDDIKNQNIINKIKEITFKIKTEIDKIK